MQQGLSVNRQSELMWCMFTPGGWCAIGLCTHQAGRGQVGADSSGHKEGEGPTWCQGWAGKEVVHGAQGPSYGLPSAAVLSPPLLPACGPTTHDQSLTDKALATGALCGPCIFCSRLLLTTHSVD